MEDASPARRRRRVASSEGEPKKRKLGRKNVDWSANEQHMFAMLQILVNDGGNTSVQITYVTDDKHIPFSPYMEKQFYYLCIDSALAATTHPEWTTWRYEEKHDEYEIRRIKLNDVNGRQIRLKGGDSKWTAVCMVNPDFAATALSAVAAAQAFVLPPCPIAPQQHVQQELSLLPILDKLSVGVDQVSGRLHLQDAEAWKQYFPNSVTLAENGQASIPPDQLNAIYCVIIKQLHEKMKEMQATIERLSK